MSDDIKLPELPEPQNAVGFMAGRYYAIGTPSDLYFNTEQLQAYGRAAVELNRAWLPIESAPRDGTYVILGFAGSHSEEGRWVGDPERNHWGETGWFATDDDVWWAHPSNPSHYMKLPTSPEQGED